MKYLTQAQVNEIQGQLKRRGQNSVSLAAHLGRPASSVASTINGHRHNPAIRQDIAVFLGTTVAELFETEPAALAARPMPEQSPAPAPGPLAAVLARARRVFGRSGAAPAASTPEEAKVHG